MNAHINRSMWFIAALSGGLMLPLSANAASFDCAKASTKVEHIICDNPEISKLDDDLSTAYKAALQDQLKAESIKQAQKQWMKERNGCADAGCVKHAYEGRLKMLAAKNMNVEPGKAEIKAPAQADSNDKKSDGQEFPQKPPKPRYAICDRSKPELYCEGSSGKGYSVCEDYLKYLQTLTSPPTCEAPIPPGFSQPDWEEMDVTQHLDLAYQAEEYFLKRFGGYKHPDFDAWRKTFLQEIKEGKINPRMRKAKVTPTGKDEATILAYTRDREACHKSYEWEKKRKVEIDKLPADTPAWKIANLLPGYPYPYWRDQGYVHLVLTNEEPSKLQTIVGDASEAQMELLLYAGRAYLVEILDPLAPIFHPLGGNPYRGLTNSPIFIFAFDPHFPDTRPSLDLNHYLVNRYCQVLPY